MTTSSRTAAALGLASIAFAVAFNVPYAILATIFDYPGVLRRPAGEVLALFHAGGAPLILTWHAFALAALLFVPLSLALSLRDGTVERHPVLAIGAAVAGSLAGLAQAIGLWRWVFVVPSLATVHADPAAPEALRQGAESTFELINLYGGVAIGEHLGQLLTALFIVLLASLQLTEGRRITGFIGVAAAAAMIVGTNEGLAIALGGAGDLFSLFTIGGFLALSAWLIATGLGLLGLSARRTVSA